MTANLTFSPSKTKTVKLPSSDVVRLVDESVTYPKYHTLKKEEVAECVITLDYKCDSSGCNMAEMMQTISQSGELKAQGVRDLTRVTAAVIDTNPDVFPSSTIAGYLFQNNDSSYLFLRNATPGLDLKQCRCGFVDVNEVRKKLLFQAMARKSSEEESLRTAATVVVTSMTVVGMQKLLIKK